MNPSWQILAAKFVRRQAKQLARQFDGVCEADDIEFIHRARVATRRLRAALRVLEGNFSAVQLRQWRKAIRRIARKLGNARDLDVQIDYICGVLAEVRERHLLPGIVRVLVQLERDRERLQPKVIREVECFGRRGVLRKIRRTVKAILALGEGSDIIDRHISERIKEMLDWQDCLNDPADRARHHKMRIAAKRLRYTLEIARFVWPERFEEAVEASKTIQTFLGEVHDCDIWLNRLAEFSVRQRRRARRLGRFVRLQSGIEYLARDRLQHRQESFKLLGEYWGNLQGRQFWQKLLEKQS